MSNRYLDEDSVRTRPPRSTRPRSRLRPAYADAPEAMVVAVDRGRFACMLEGRTVVATRAGELRKTPVVVGDRVSLAGDASGTVDTLARIVRVAERTSVLRRTADDTDPVERPIVGNADLLVVVASLADPPTGARFVDRCLVAAYDGGLEPLLCLTKRDLADPAPVAERWSPYGLPIVTTSVKLAGCPGVDDLTERLAGRVSVMIGHSGVGKSTLVNLLVPDADRRVGEVSAIGKGRHTSTSVVALPLPGGGWIIDTPGIRSFGLGGVSPERVLRAFPDLLPGEDECPRGCTHTEPESGECGLDVLVAKGEAGADRLDSYRRLLAARDTGDEE